MLVTTCLRVVTNRYELVTSIYDPYDFLQKKYKSYKSQSIIIRQLTSIETTWHMRETNCSYIYNFYNCSDGRGRCPAATSHLQILASSLRMITCCCERFTIPTDCYELFMEKSIRGQSSVDFLYGKKFACPFTDP